ncbi:MAG TPA: glycosyltransferase family 39 protein [Vicinamibacterales bacterium]|nr:glycosyltransferase family 39 protein [Vicinamibacterales bacterium]
MSRTRFLACAVLLFTVLTAVMTYPQVLHLPDGVHDDGDPLMVTWVLAWVAHQLPRAPAHLFDANIFYPERNTLAYSENLIVPGVAAAPLQWLGVGPILIYNLVFLSGFALSGVGVALLVRRLTGSVGAAVLSGIVFAFPPYRIDHYAHLQLQQTQFIPLAMLAFHRLLDTNRLRDGVWLGVCVACQMLSCVYYGLFLIPYMAVVCGAMLAARRELPRQRLIALALAAVIVGAVMVPVGRAYVAARAVVGERGRAEVADGSATWRNYLAPPEVNAVYGKVFARFMQPERRLFPGFVAIALAIWGLWPPLTATRIAYGLGLLLAFDVSLGLNGILYGALYDYFLPFKALRIPARMGLMVGFSLAVLGGYGATRIADAMRTPTARRATFGVLGVLMLIEYASTPLPLWSAPRTAPESYADLLRDNGDAPTAILFEFPTLSTSDPAYLYYSTFHWQYLINGYSGFVSPSYIRMVRSLRNFPDEVSIDAIKARGVRYLVIHGEYLRGDRYETLLPQLDRRRDLTLVSRRPWAIPGKHAEISVYRVTYQ